jgi:hypothetical protein
MEHHDDYTVQEFFCKNAPAFRLYYRQHKNGKTDVQLGYQNSRTLLSGEMKNNKLELTMLTHNSDIPIGLYADALKNIQNLFQVDYQNILFKRPEKIDPLQVSGFIETETRLKDALSVLQNI